MQVEATGPELPIACTLDPGELRARGAMFAAIVERSLCSCKRYREYLELQFRNDPGTQSDLARFVELESRCCPFLRFALRSGESTVALTITGPPDAGAVLDAIYDVAGHPATAL